MPFVELSHYTLAQETAPNGLHAFDLALNAGEPYAIEADSQSHARVLLKALATLEPPHSGDYRFDGHALNFSDYRQLLPIKQKIGYIAPDATMISNRSVLDNLLLMRYYFENSFALQLADETEKLCRLFSLQDKLEMRPAELNPLDFHMAIAIRELSKAPQLLLMERPENLIGDHRVEQFIVILKERVLQNLTIVFISYNQSFNAVLATHKILIAEGRVTTTTR